MPAGPPPVLPVPRRARAVSTPLLMVLFPVMAGAGLQLAASAGWPLPPCVFREWTGLPCPVCGGTRAAVALAAGGWAEAFSLNPLVTVAGLGLSLGGVVLLVDAWRGGAWLARVRGVISRLPLRSLVVAALVLNWLYLWLDGRGGS